MDYAQKDWGFEMCFANTSLYSAHMLVVGEGKQTPRTYNKKRDLTIFVLQGVIVIEGEGKSHTINQGESYHIPPKLIYRLKALTCDATILEVGTKIEDNDVVLVEA